MLVHLSALVFLLAAPPAQQQEVFGIKWCSTPQQAVLAGVKLKKDMERTTEHISIYDAVRLPKGLSGFENYVLIYHKDRCLVKVTAVGTTIDDSADGTHGKQEFERLENILAAKYVAAMQAKHIGRKLYEEEDEFYQCLGYEGCGRWIIFLEGPDRKIMLELHSAGRSSGYLVFTVESNLWSDVLKESEDSKNSKDAEAL